MNHFKNITLIICLVFLSMACSKDFLERQSLTDETEDNFYQTEEQALQAVVAIYDALQYINGRTADSYAPWDIVNNILSDDAYAGGSGSGDRPGLVRMNAQSMNATDSELLALWEDSYTGIARANIFLARVEGINFEQEARKNRLIAEAKFLRAHFYFQLVQMYGWVPLILEPLSPERFLEPTQAEPLLTFQQIATDLMDAINGGLPKANQIPGNEYGRISEEAAKAMLMRVFLYYEGYGKGVLGISQNLATKAGAEVTRTMVQGFGDDIITGGSHSLVPAFANLWGVANEVNSEFIFTVRFSDIRDWGDWGARNYSEGNWAAIMYGFRIQEDDVYAEGWSFAPATLSLVESFTSNDTRKAASFVHESEITSLAPGYQHTGYAFKKFHPTKKDDPQTANRMLNQPFDRPVIRYADVLLMAAELYLPTDMGKATDYFNQVYKRARGVDFAGTLDLDLIFAERRKEFAGEGHRYMDMKRRGLNYMQSAYQVVSLGGDFNVSFNAAHKALLPIPQREINLNPKIQQKVY